MENKDRRQEGEEEELQQQRHLGPSRGGQTGEESPVLGIRTTPAHGHDGVEEIFAPAEPRNNTDDNGANHDGGDEEEDDDDEESEFEFAFASNLPTITAADEIFSDGRIRPIYPVFDRGLYLYYQSHQPAAGATAEEGEEDHQQQQQQGSVPLRVPLRDLIMQQRSSTTASTSEVLKSTRTSVDGASSSSASAVRLARASSFSSSDADDLEGVPAGTYCVWTPGSVPPSPEHLGKKSRSTGSTGIRRWSLRDLVLGRSHSDGRQKLMFFQHEQAAGEAKSGTNYLEEAVEEEEAKGKKNKDKKSAEHNKEEDEKKNKKKHGKNTTTSSKDHPKGASTTAPTQRKKKPAAAVSELDLATAHRLYYRNEALKSAGGPTDSPARRRSSSTFLPYRKDLFVGIFVPHARRAGRGAGMGFPQPPSSSFYGF